MKTSLFLGSALALLMVSSFGYADSNTSYLKQVGNDNTGQITQSGSANTAGTNNYGNNEEKLIQSGDNNALSITQTGKHNVVGQGPDGDGQGGTGTSGIRQTGDHNAITIGQDGGNYYYGGHVVVIEQNAAHNAGVTANTNVLQLTQSDNTNDDAGNYVGRVSQTNTGDGSSAANANTLTVTQTVDARWPLTHRAYMAGDQARRLIQNGIANNATLTQHGLDNIVKTLSQTGTANSATVNFQGNFNGNDVNPSSTNFYSYGVGTGHNVAFSADAAVATGVEQGSIIQSGTNMLGMMVIGNLNLFGTAQYGQNSLTIDVTGSSNQIAAVQGSALVPTIGGIGDVAITGDSNVIGLQQIGGDGNTASVTLYGSNNNNIASNYFTGAAASVTDGTSVLTPGLIKQDGASNTVDLNVGALGAPSNSNLFAVLQSGSNNKVTGSISGGSSNQVAVAQLGSWNTTAFTQVGSFNIIGVKQ
jgi:hypothetical protein